MSFGASEPACEALHGSESTAGAGRVGSGEPKVDLEAGEPSDAGWANVGRKEVMGYERSPEQVDYEILRDTIIAAFEMDLRLAAQQEAEQLRSQLDAAREKWMTALDLRARVADERDELRAEIERRNTPWQHSDLWGRMSAADPEIREALIQAWNERDRLQAKVAAALKLADESDSYSGLAIRVALGG